MDVGKTSRHISLQWVMLARCEQVAQLRTTSRSRLDTTDQNAECSNRPLASHFRAEIELNFWNAELLVSIILHHRQCRPGHFHPLMKRSHKYLQWHFTQDLNHHFQKLVPGWKLHSQGHSLDIAEEDKVAWCEVRGAGWMWCGSQVVIVQKLLNPFYQLWLAPSVCTPDLVRSRVS
jgi:hypothetical protein